MEMEWVAHENNTDVYRIKVPGGWLVITVASGGEASAICYFPDTMHEWKV